VAAPDVAAREHGLAEVVGPGAAPVPPALAQAGAAAELRRAVAPEPEPAAELRRAFQAAPLAARRLAAIQPGVRAAEAMAPPYSPRAAA